MRASLSIVAVAVVIVGAAVACSAEIGPEASMPLPEGLDPTAVAHGETLYVRYCASCHGIDLSGDPDWMTPNADGSYPPPPHDSTGHTWHHSDGLLLEIVRDGSPFARSNMPAFGSILADDDIMAIIEYFKAHWGVEEREFQRSVTEREARSRD
jgi:mono/diheme cytochrome c family protein